MNVGILIEDQGYKGLDFSQPEKGNPGVSGTVFEFIMLVKYLLMYNTDISVYVYHYNSNKLPLGCNDIILDNRNSVCRECSNKINIIVVQNGLPKDFYLNDLNIPNLKVVFWAHNYLTGTDVEYLLRMKNLARVVFVGKEQYDHYVGHDIIKKSTYIYNMFNSKCAEYCRSEDLHHVVTYTGSIIQAKGFHMLANVWKDILNEVPDAELNVIGSGKLYDRGANLGKYNIADEDYENKFIGSIIDSSGNILPSVHFLGVLGKEKIDVYKRTMVGVMNPTGNTETFGLSAVEMEACGIPMVTRKQYGLLDTVIHKKTGYLINNESELKKRIIELLKDKSLNYELGVQAQQYVRTEFAPEHIIKDWIKLFSDIECGRNIEYLKPNKNYFNHYKWIMILNRKIRRVIPIFPSIIGFKARIKLRNCW